jgi:hypothetical protein
MKCAIMVKGQAANIFNCIFRVRFFAKERIFRRGIGQAIIAARWHLPFGD